MSGPESLPMLPQKVPEDNVHTVIILSILPQHPSYLIPLCFIRPLCEALERHPLLGILARMLTPFRLGFPGLKSMASALLFCSGSGEGDVEFPAYGLRIRKLPVS